MPTPCVNNRGKVRNRINISGTLLMMMRGYDNSLPVYKTYGY